MTDEAYAKLVDELLAATKDLRKDKLFGAAMALKAVMNYLEMTGAPKEAAAPLAETFFLLAEASFAGDHRGKGGPKHKKLGKLAALSAAAAAVTVMKERDGGLVDDAVAQVSRATGIGRAELKKFRDSLHRGTAHPLADGFYRADLEKQRPMVAAELGSFLAAVKKLHRLYL